MSKPTILDPQANDKLIGIIVFRPAVFAGFRGLHETPGDVLVERRSKDGTIVARG